jgi:hypothetical protein
LLYDVALPEAGASFELKVTRKATGEAIFDTTGHRYVNCSRYSKVEVTAAADGA